MEYTLEDNVMRVLRSPEVSRINFRLLGVDVRGTAYSEIADKILEGYFKVPEIEGNIGDGAAAKYSRKSNTFRFGSQHYDFREWRSYVVHEATHGLIDYKRIKISKIDDEVVAHVAHTLYLRRAGFGFKSHGITNTTWYVARDVADSIIRSGTADQKLVGKLQETIKNDPLYHSFIGEMADTDG